MDKYEYTFPVAGFEPNHHGLCDMDGNVLQWCEEQLPEDQCLAGAARAGMYVLRGSSSQHFDPGDFLSSRRKNGYRDRGCNDRGFRCVLVGGGGFVEWPFYYPSCFHTLFHILPYVGLFSRACLLRKNRNN